MKVNVTAGKSVGAGHDWTSGVVAVMGRHGRPAGSAFLVSRAAGLLVTCAHVLHNAGWDKHQNTSVQIRFNLSEPEPFVFCSVKILLDCYRAPDAEDVAYLQVQEELPVPVLTLSMAPAADSEGDAVHTLGYPPEYPQGLRGEGKVSGLVTIHHQRRLQLSSMEFTVGYSGGPLWNPRLGRVVGMIHSGHRADKSGRHKFTAFGIPAETLLAVGKEQLAPSLSVSLPAARQTLAADDLPDIPRTLRASVDDGTLSLFVGSSLVALAGLPTMPELMHELADIMGESLPPEPHLSRDLLDIAAAYEYDHGRNSLNSFLMKRMSTLGVEPPASYIALAKLPVKTIFTDTLDDLLEQALRRAGRRANVVVRDASIPYASSDTVQVIKLNGDLQQPDTMVITQQDHNTYEKKHPLISQALQARLASETFLFVGCDLANPRLSLASDRIGHDVQVQRRHHAVVFDAPHSRRGRWLQHAGIQVTTLQATTRPERDEYLSAWLSSLASQ